MAHRRVGNILQYLVCKMNVFVFVAKSQQFYSRTLDFKGEINKMARSRKMITPEILRKLVEGLR